LAAAGSGLLYGKYLTVPKQVGLNVAAIGGGQTHSVAVQTDGTVWGWGHNTYDPLCGGTSTSLPDTVYTPIDFGQCMTKPQSPSCAARGGIAPLAGAGAEV